MSDERTDVCDRLPGKETIVAQRHFVLTLIDAAAASRRICSVNALVPFGRFGSSPDARLAVVLNCEELKVDSPVGLSRRKQ